MSATIVLVASHHSVTQCPIRNMTRILLRPLLSWSTIGTNSEGGRYVFRGATDTHSFLCLVNMHTGLLPSHLCLLPLSLAFLNYPNHILPMPFCYARTHSLKNIYNFKMCRLITPHIQRGIKLWNILLLYFMTINLCHIGYAVTITTVLENKLW